VPTPAPVERFRQSRYGSAIAGSLDCLLKLEVRTKPPDRSIETCARGADGVAADNGHLVERHVEIEKVGDDQPIAMTESRQGAT
jgi:hypothetical protein